MSNQVALGAAAQPRGFDGKRSIFAYCRKRAKVGLGWAGFLAGLLILVLGGPGWSTASLAAESSPTADKTHPLAEIVVSSSAGDQAVALTPTSTTIVLDNYDTIIPAQNVGDYLKNLIMFDYRGGGDLVPSDDSFSLRSFETNRFVMAIDGLDLRRTGGRKSTNIVDYAYLPPFLLEKIEVLPGPHSALYPAKSIGGVVNLVSRAPALRADAVPELKVSTSYKSYNTQNYTLSAQGSADRFAYDLGYQKYKTDGYLRNSEAEISTVVGRVGYVIPSGGHLALTGSYSDNDKRIPVNNDPGDKATQYDSAYPVVTGSAFNHSDDPSWDGNAFSYRLDYRQPTRLGELSAEASYAEETKDRAYLDKGVYTSMFTRYYQQAAKLQDRYRFNDRHETTLEVDGQQLYDGDHDTKDKRMEIKGVGVQHQWRIIPRLSLTAGLRYEQVDIWVSNTTTTGKYITGRPDWIERNWGEVLPKSMLTYELDDLATVLRDTSLSLGVSRIWRAPDYHGDYNPQGRPSGAWLDPEHGLGIDAILKRRLVGNIEAKLSYFHYIIEDYIANNSNYAKYTPSAKNKVTPGMEYKDYKINLDEMVRKGVELEIGGNLLPDLSFYLGATYQKLENQGNELAGYDAESNVAKYRVTAGLRYNLFKNVKLLLDYKFQDKQVAEVAEQLTADTWTVREVAIDAYHLVDFGVQFNLFKQWGPCKDGVLRLFVENAFDATYYDTSGYPGTDRTYGVGLSFRL